VVKLAQKPVFKAKDKALQRFENLLVSITGQVQSVDRHAKGHLFFVLSDAQVTVTGHGPVDDVNYMHLGLFEWQTWLNPSIVKVGAKLTATGLVEHYRRRSNGEAGYGIRRIMELHPG